MKGEELPLTKAFVALLKCLVTYLLLFRNIGPLQAQLLLIYHNVSRLIAAEHRVTHRRNVITKSTHAECNLWA